MLWAATLKLQYTVLFATMTTLNENLNCRFFTPPTLTNYFNRKEEFEKRKHLEWSRVVGEKSKGVNVRVSIADSKHFYLSSSLALPFIYICLQV